MVSNAVDLTLGSPSARVNTALQLQGTDCGRDVGSENQDGSVGIAILQDGRAETVYS